MLIGQQFLDVLNYDVAAVHGQEAIKLDEKVSLDFAEACKM